MKKLLLVSSIITFLLLVIAIAVENFFTEWEHYQKEYKEVLKKKATDEFGKQLYENFSVELKQIVVPELKVVDRCISCHSGLDDPRMADQKNPHKTHPGNILENHPYEKYGCTICHRGQGRAVVFGDAHSSPDIHWDYPLLSKEFAQSGCAMCHAPDSLKESAPLAAKGYQLFVENACSQCHKVGGVGGVLGPALDKEGVKKEASFPFANIKGEHTIVNWHIEHLLDPQKVVPGSKMKNYGFTYDEAKALTVFILSLQGLDIPTSYIPQDRFAWKW